MVTRRLPDSRSLKVDQPDLVFERVNEVLSHNSLNYKKKTSTRLISLNSTANPEKIPIKTRALEEWPSFTLALCLHCSEPCPGTPLPVVKFMDTATSSYWISGYFCRPCCSLAYIQNDIQFASDRTRCSMWTREVLSRFFKIKTSSAAPPRSALQKFGGPLTLAEFYGEDVLCTRFIEVHCAPFVSYAMYAEVMRGSTNVPKDADILTLETGIRQPAIRTEPIAHQESTQKIPLLLEFLSNLAKTRFSSVQTGKKETDIEEEEPEPRKNAKKKRTTNAAATIAEKNETNTTIAANTIDIFSEPKEKEKEKEQVKKSKAPKTVLKRAKKMELEEALSGNKTRSLLSYANR